MVGLAPCSPPCPDVNCAVYGCLLVELPDYPSHHLPQCFIGLPSFAEALAEPPHGRVGANDAVEEAICQRYHGMSRAEWNALPDDHERED